MELPCPRSTRSNAARGVIGPSWRASVCGHDTRPPWCGRNGTEPAAYRPSIDGFSPVGGGTLPPMSAPRRGLVDAAEHPGGTTPRPILYLTTTTLPVFADSWI